MLNPPMLGEVEHRLLVEPADVEVAFRREHLVAVAGRHGDDLAGRRDNAAAGEQFAAFFVAGFGDADDPGAVLVGAGLHAQMIVKIRQVVVDRNPWQMGRGVVAEQDQLNALHAHDPIGLRPAPVVADAHADVGVERAPYRKTQISRLEISLFKMLKRVVRTVVGVAG